jgi:hypothetical protein
VLHREPADGANEHAFVRLHRQHPRLLGDAAVLGEATMKAVGGTDLKTVPGVELGCFVGREDVKVLVAQGAQMHIGHAPFFRGP